MTDNIKKPGIPIDIIEGLEPDSRPRYEPGMPLPNLDDKINPPYNPGMPIVLPNIIEPLGAISPVFSPEAIEEWAQDRPVAGSGEGLEAFENALEGSDGFNELENMKGYLRGGFIDVPGLQKIDFLSALDTYGASIEGTDVQGGLDPSRIDRAHTLLQEAQIGDPEGTRTLALAAIASAGGSLSEVLKTVPAEVTRSAPEAQPSPAVLGLNMGMKVQ